MLRVVTDGPYGSRFQEDMSRGVVIVESDLGRHGSFADAIEELNSVAARTKAQGWASQRGMAYPRINGNVGPAYPVNGDGVPLEFVKDDKGDAYPLTHPRMRPARYRIDVPLTQPLL